MIKYRDVLTKISVHPLFWVIIVIGIFTARFKELLLLFCIVLIHELGHAFATRHYNWRIKKIQLLPFGGVAELEEHGNKSLKEELVVVIAGPIQHIWMMAVGYMLFEAGWLHAELYYFFMWNNIIILAFNLLPIWPLDGGKVLFNVLSYRFPYLQAHEKMMKLSCVFFSVILGWQLLWNSNNIMMWVLLIFLAVSLYQEWKQRRYAFMRFFIRTLLWEQKEELKRLHRLRCNQKIIYIRYSQNFVEAISILLSSAENIKNITHWMKMNCFMRILLKNEQLHLLKN